MTEEEILFLIRANAGQFIAENEAAAGSVAQLGVATEETGLAMSHTTRRSYLMNQALFTIRRLLYGTTLALIGTGIAAAKWGWDFNSAMQQARVALQPVAGDLGGVQHELDYLFNFTKYTPFQFKDVTIAFRQMYLGMRTIGISATDVNQTLQAMVDALSATGRTSPGALNRVAVALQHMGYMGHITGQVVLQLARDGLPIYAALQKELGLTGEQIHQIGKLGIPAIDVLHALNRYIESTPGFMNAAHRQAVNSFHGLFTTFRDNVSQIMGQVEIGFFHRLQGDLANMNAWFDRTGAAIKQGGGSATAVINAIDPAALPLWNAIVADLHMFWVNFSLIIGAFMHSTAFWGVIYLGLQSLHVVLVLLNPLLGTLGFWLNILIPLWVTWKAVTIAAAISTGTLALVEAATAGATKDLTFAQFLLALYMGRYNLVVRLATFATALYATGQVYAAVVTTALGEAAIWLRTQLAILWVLMELNPVVLLITTVVLLVAGLVILYFKWKAFHDLVNETWNWIQNHALLVSAAITIAFGPLGAVIASLLLIIRYWNHIKDLMRGNIGSALGIPGGHWWSQGGIGHALGLPNSVTGYRGAADGGTVISSGLAWVGERGPELMRLPTGAQITPHRDVYNLQESWMRGNQRDGRPLKIQVVVNRRILGEVIAEEMALQQARA